MPIKVRVDSQVPAPLGLMEAAALEVGIGKQPGKAGKLFKETEKRLAVQLREEVPDSSGGNFMRLELKLKPLLVAVEVPPILSCRKIIQDLPQDVSLEEIVDDNVGKGLRTAILLCKGTSEDATFVGIEGEIIANWLHVQHDAILQ